MKPVIGFAGLSHLGINSAAATAARGFQTVGYHDDASFAARLSDSEPNVNEPGLREMLREHSSRLRFSADASVLRACDIVYISIDVPTDDEGRSDLAPIDRIVDTAISAMKPDAILVVLCQVSPGYTRKLPVAAERLYYQVETLIFGRAVERALNPERFIVGCADPNRPIDPRMQKYLAAFDCPILTMRYESAELAKISINMYLVASVSITNTLAELCESIGADWSEIVPSLRLDRRIGQYAYLTPGLGIAGGNLERDLATITELAAAHNTDASVVAAELANSRHRKDWTWQILKSHGFDHRPGLTIALLGLAYKENTHSTKNSAALALLARLRGKTVRVFDPVISTAPEGSDAVVADSELAAAEGADAVCIMTPWPQFSTIDPKALKDKMRGLVLIDPYRMIDGAAAKAAGLSYATLGVASRVRA
jgi:UDPglucose 6-dehydrogenase